MATFWSVLGTIGIVLIIIILIVMVIAMFCIIRAAGIASKNEDVNYYAEQAEALCKYNDKKKNK